MSRLDEATDGRGGHAQAQQRQPPAVSSVVRAVFAGVGLSGGDRREAAAPVSRPEPPASLEEGRQFKDRALDVGVQGAGMRGDAGRHVEDQKPHALGFGRLLLWRQLGLFDPL